MYEYVYNGSAYNKQVNIKHVFVCIQSLAAILRSSGAGENEPQETVEPSCLSSSLCPHMLEVPPKVFW